MARAQAQTPRIGSIIITRAMGGCAAVAAAVRVDELRPSTGYKLYVTAVAVGITSIATTTAGSLIDIQIQEYGQHADESSRLQREILAWSRAQQVQMCVPDNQERHDRSQ